MLTKHNAPHNVANIDGHINPLTSSCASSAASWKCATAEHVLYAINRHIILFFAIALCVLHVHLANRTHTKTQTYCTHKDMQRIGTDNYTCIANCRNYLFIERLNADSLHNHTEWVWLYGVAYENDFYVHLFCVCVLFFSVKLLSSNCSFL